MRPTLSFFLARKRAVDGLIEKLKVKGVCAREKSEKGHYFNQPVEF